MAHTLNTVLDTLKTKLSSVATSATEIKDLVYLAKSVEAITGADFLLNLASNQNKNPLVLDIGDDDTEVNLSAEQLTNNVIRIINSSGTQSAASIKLNMPTTVTSFILVNDVSCPVVVTDSITVANGKKALIVSDGDVVDNGFTPTTESLNKLNDLTFYNGHGLGETTLSSEGSDKQLRLDKTSTPIWVPKTGRTGMRLFTGNNFDPKTYDPNSLISGRTIPDSADENNFPLFKSFNPYGRGQCTNSNYSAQLYKLDNGLFRMKGQRTQSNYGARDYYNYGTGFQLSFDEDRKDVAISSVSTAIYSTYVLFEDGACWSVGNNTNGMLGVNDTSARYKFTELNWFTGANDSRSMKQLVIAGGENTDYTTCAAVTGIGDVYCWGYNGVGSTGTGGTGATNAPTATSISNISKVWGGGGAQPFFYAWSELDQTLYSWGANAHGQCAQGNTSNVTAPAEVTIPGGRIPKTIICMGYQATDNTLGSNVLILMTDGTIWGAGKNAHGELAKNNTSQQNSLTQVANSGYGIRIDASDDASTADEIWATGETSFGAVFCRMKDGSTAAWGNNGTYEFVGGGHGVEDVTVAQIIPQLRNVKKMIFGHSHNGSDDRWGAALDGDGVLWTIGYNGYGTLGCASSETPLRYEGYGWNPVYQPAGARFQGHIIDMQSFGYSSSNHIAAITDELEMFAWGYNGHHAVTGQYDGTNVFAPYYITGGSY